MRNNDIENNNNLNNNKEDNNKEIKEIKEEYSLSSQVKQIKLKLK